MVDLHKILLKVECIIIHIAACLMTVCWQFVNLLNDLDPFKSKRTFLHRRVGRLGLERERSGGAGSTQTGCPSPRGSSLANISFKRLTQHFQYQQIKAAYNFNIGDILGYLCSMFASSSGWSTGMDGMYGSSRLILPHLHTISVGDMIPARAIMPNEFETQ